MDFQFLLLSEWVLEVIEKNCPGFWDHLEVFYFLPDTFALRQIPKMGSDLPGASDIESEYYNVIRANTAEVADPKKIKTNTEWSLNRYSMGTFPRKMYVQVHHTIYV